MGPGGAARPDGGQHRVGAAARNLQGPSADALQASSASFLQLAGHALGKYQEGARGDLEKRQQAIGELVAPVREALGRFEAQVGSMEQKRAGAAQALLRTEASNLVRALRAP